MHGRMLLFCSGCVNEIQKKAKEKEKKRIKEEVENTVFNNTGGIDGYN